MKGLEGKGDYSERGEKEKQSKKKKKDTRTPIDVRPQTCVTCVE